MTLTIERKPRYKHIRGLERIVRLAGLWKSTGNTLPPMVNNRYQRNLVSSQTAFLEEMPSASSWPDSPSAIQGYQLVEKALDETYARNCSNKMGEAIERGQNIERLPNSTKLKRPFDVFGSQVLDTFRGPLDEALKHHFKSNYRIEWLDAYRSTAAENRTGSWLWHKDNVPSSCIKAMIHLTNTTAESGAMQFLDWSDTLKLHKAGYFGVRARERVADISKWAADHGQSVTVRHVAASPGDVLLFNNNLLHSAVPPTVGFRDVCTVMIVPFERPWDDALRLQGIDLIQDFTDGYPSDPAFHY